MKKSIIVALLILILVISWFLSGYFLKSNSFRKVDLDNNENKVESDTNTIDINKIQVEILLSNTKEIDQTITLQGQSLFNRFIDIKSETTGNITKKNFIRGDTVKKNDLLIEISIEDRNELLNSFNKEFSRIEKEIILNKEKKENNILKANEQINLFQIEYNSAKELLDKGLGSESKLSLASLNLTQAKTNLKDIDINYQSQSINLESQLENIRSKIKNINLDIENTKILAPFGGIIESSYVEEGTFVRPGDMIVKIVDLNPIKIQGYISESNVNKIKLGKTANIQISNSLKKSGIITFISPVAETSTRTFEFIVEASNDDLLFKSGQTATISIDINSVKAHKISPSILTLQDDGSVGIKVLNNKNKVIFYPIEKVKDTIDGMWVTGLPDQIRIIITGQEYVTEGQIVEIQ